MSLRSCLYAGQVYHKRTRPVEHVLRYSVFSMLVDIGEIDDIARQCWPFSHNRFNLFSFHDKDFGEGGTETLHQYIERKLSEADICTMPTRVLLSCYPRVLGHVFNPLSVFYCLDDFDNCYAVIHEVHNTFGERHAYALPVHDNLNKTNRWIDQTTDKSLFVSPFAHMDMHYEFRLNQPEDRQVIVIRASDEEGLLITASYNATRQLLTTSQLLRHFFKIPVLGFKVVGGIHWEALKLWLKRVPLYKHQPKRST